jgi:hypothetical protein
MPLSFDPRFNDLLQHLILMAPPVGQINLNMLDSIEPEAIANPDELVATIIEVSTRLAAKKSDAPDRFVELLLKLERINALPHDKAQHFTDRVLAYSRDN